MDQIYMREWNGQKLIGLENYKFAKWVVLSPLKLIGLIKDTAHFLVNYH